jgi:hypothetical protein
MRALTNDGKNTDHKQFFSEEQSKKLLRFSNSKWKLCREPKAQASRGREGVKEEAGKVVELNVAELKTPAIKKAVKVIDEITVLEKALAQELNASILTY